jgi:hypothetical protein
MAASENSGIHTKRMVVRCPPTLVEAVELAAARNFMSLSEYMRRCAIDRVKADGIDPAQMAGAVKMGHRTLTPAKRAMIARALTADHGKSSPISDRKHTHVTTGAAAAAEMKAMEKEAKAKKTK